MAYCGKITKCSFHISPTSWWLSLENSSEGRGWCFLDFPGCLRAAHGCSEIVNVNFLSLTSVSNVSFLICLCWTAILANQMEKLQDLSQSELQELLDSPERVESMALESDEVKLVLHSSSPLSKRRLNSLNEKSGVWLCGIAVTLQPVSNLNLKRSIKSFCQGYISSVKSDKDEAVSGKHFSFKCSVVVWYFSSSK